MILHLGRTFALGSTYGLYGYCRRWRGFVIAGSSHLSVLQLIALLGNHSVLLVARHLG